MLQNFKGNKSRTGCRHLLTVSSEALAAGGFCSTITKPICQEELKEQNHI